MKRVYHGWYVLLVAALAMVGTLPGRTQGLGLVTEPLLTEFQLDRVTWAQINFWATLIGSTFAVGSGRLIDRWGNRLVLTLTALTLGVVVCGMSAATTLVAIASLTTLTRGVGQSALSVVSLSMIGQWFVRRLSLAMGAYAIVMSVGFMIAFPVVGALVQSRGWRSAWLAIGVALIVALAPLAWVIVRRSPEAMGLSDEVATQPSGTQANLGGWMWRDALATPGFWVFAIGSALYGLVASGIGLFNESILAERGFGASVYYQTLVVTALTALAGNFGGGVLADRWTMPRLMFIAMAILAAGLAALPVISTLSQVLLWAAAMGVGGGFVMVLFFGFFPRAFGRRELGRIQGVAQALTVIASAIGPLLLAQCVEWTGSYGAMFWLLAVIVGVNGVAALLVEMPEAEPRPNTGVFSRGRTAMER
jgi:MFS family permease